MTPARLLIVKSYIYDICQVTHRQVLHIRHPPGYSKPSPVSFLKELVDSLFLSLPSHCDLQPRKIKNKAELYDKRDDFTFPIVNFPFISSNGIKCWESMAASLCHRPIETNQHLVEHNYYLLELQLSVETLVYTVLFVLWLMTPLTSSNFSYNTIC
jgi:hypothetical protein